MELPAAPGKFDLPDAQIFRDVGLAYLNSDLENEESNLRLSIRSSPLGPNAHTHADNNTFNMAYGGQRLFYNSGYRPSMGDPHFLAWHKHTRGHNGVLMDDHGQPYDAGAYGYLPRFLHGKEISYAVGDASHAWQATDEETIDYGLEKFRRHYIMLRPNVIIIYDELEADHPAEWSWLLHHYEGLEIDAGRGTIYGENGSVGGLVNLYGSVPIDFKLTDQFSVPAQNFRGTVDEDGSLVEYTNHWHFRGVTKEKTTEMRYLAIIQVREDKQFVAVENLGEEGHYRIEEWEVHAVLDATEPALITVKKSNQLAGFTSSGSLKIDGNRYSGTSTASAKLIEMVNGAPVFNEAVDVLPASMIAAQRRFSP